MTRIVRFAIVLLTLAGAGGCSWTSAGGGPLTPERRASVLADATEGPPPPQELFTSDPALRFALEADFSLLAGDRARESEERPGRVVVTGRDGVRTEIPVEVKTRGNFRLRPEICTFPPLRLDFPSSEPYGTVFDGADKLKLVTQCKHQGEYEQNLLEEYLAYRIYNVITDVSFRVQRVEVTYLDSSGENRPATRPAFLIEEDEALAARLGGEVVDVPGLEPDMLDAGELGLMYLFQYMIGNTDWSTDSGHNVEFIRTPETVFAVPYDFDFSGLVDAPYAGPAPSLADSIRSVRDRFYRGYCVERIDQQAVLNRFREARQDVLALVEDLPGLSYPGRLSARRYLEEFFDELGYPHRVDRNIIHACRR